MPFCKCLTSYQMIFALFWFCPVLILDILDISPRPYIPLGHCLCGHFIWHIACPTDKHSDCCPVSVVITCVAVIVLSGKEVCMLLRGRYQEVRIPPLEFSFMSYSWVPSLLAGPASSGRDAKMDKMGLLPPQSPAPAQLLLVLHPTP